MEPVKDSRFSGLVSINDNIPTTSTSKKTPTEQKNKPSKPNYWSLNLMLDKSLKKSKQSQTMQNSFVKEYFLQTSANSLNESQLAPLPNQKSQPL